jgi:Outer membrane protein beta-barrel domain
MLNLSDKELDRLSKEAAQEYEPGEVLGPRSWERLEVRLDNTPGGANPNPLRHIRRFPFYYAPALLVLIGISYYFVKQGTKGSGSPPTFGLAKTPAPVDKNPPSTTNPVYTDKSTPVPPSSVNPSATANTDAGAADPRAAVPASEANAPGAATANAADVAATAAGARSRTKTKAEGRGSLTASYNHNVLTGQNAAAGQNGLPGRNRTPGKNGVRGRNSLHGQNGSLGQNGLADDNGISGTIAANAGNTAANTGTRSGTTAGNAGNTGSQSHELNRSAIGGLASTKNRALIPDSNLRKFTLKSLPQGIHQRAMYVNRNLQIGFVLAPDFTSVNSLAGNKPGSTVGITLDYQFAHRWYIGTGFLLDRKNYAARAEDFHMSPDFRQNNVLAQHLDYVKGTFEMLEIPLNLRYDFSVSGSTLFFASAGVSSYLMTSENSGMYGSPWGSQSYQPCPATGQQSYLFSAVNLSLGVETGLSNSLSLLVAPYMKIPTRGIGFGQVQMSSVGINFALKFAPVISRKRK